MKKCFIGFLCFILMIFPISVLAKSYEIRQVSIDCTIQSNGDVFVRENRTFAFDGPFSFGYYDLPIKGYNWLREIVVLENDKPYTLNESKKPSTFWVEHLSDHHRIHYYYQASNETRTFTYEYKIEGSIAVHQDYGEFYWKLQGEGWDYPVKDFKATLHLEKPIPVGDYKVWAHGKVSGEVKKIDSQTISLTAKDVPANSFVEIRLLLPTSYFSDVPIKSDKILRSVLRQEKGKRAPSLFWIWFWNIFMYGLLFYLLVLLLYFFLRYGREYKLTENFDYIREPPSSIPPAELGFLIKFNQMHPFTVQAVLLDLIHRGFIGLEKSGDSSKKGTGIILSKNVPRSDEKLNPYEKRLMENILFKDKEKISTEELNVQIKNPANKYYITFKLFSDELAKTVKQHDFYDPKSAEIGDLVVTLGALMLGIFIVLGWCIPHSSIFIILIPLYFILGGKVIGRRSKAGKLEYDKWMALRKFLNDFSQFEKYIPASVIIWEKYLIYGVILGVSKKVIQALKVKVGEIPDGEKSNLLWNNGTDLFFAISEISHLTNSLSSVVSGLNAPSFSSGFSTVGTIIGLGGEILLGGGGGGGGSGGGMG